jgi:hypothetical protein
MNGSDEPRGFSYGSNTVWRQKARKAELKEWAREGQNWALEELEQLRRAEQRKNREAYQRFKARRTPEALRTKWRTAKAARRASQAEAEAEAEQRQRETEELAAETAAAAAADAERQREAQPELAPDATVRELQVIRAVANPRLILCAYRRDGEGHRCLINVGRNGNFVPRMKFWLAEPSDPLTRVRPWPYAGPLPRRKGRW